MRRYSLLFVVLAMALAVTAAACGDDDDDDDDEPSPVATTPAATTEPDIASPTADAEDDAAGGDEAATVVATEHPELGVILTDAEGRTLYRFEMDDPGVSNCYDQCEQAWPPLTFDSGDPVAGEGAPGTLGLHERNDGAIQVTYDGNPLYYFSGDAAAGDANGEGVGGVWFVIPLDDTARSTTGGAIPTSPVSIGY